MRMLCCVAYCRCIVVFVVSRFKTCWRQGTDVRVAPLVVEDDKKFLCFGTGQGFQLEDT